ncbi:MAG TPA: hypothetical protein VHE14_08130 [Solirubrobacteraceae bacterium]|nr:hypothetical protein [Solirubrobacteraceae bacterium]
MLLRCARAAAVLLALLTLAGCGGSSAELFAVERSGRIPGAALSLRVHDDGRVRCNGVSRRLPDTLLLEARGISRALVKPAKQRVALPPGPSSVLSYRVRLQYGTTSFADDSPGAPPAFARLQRFTRAVARQVCGLAR